VERGEVEEGEEGARVERGWRWRGLAGWIEWL